MSALRLGSTVVDLRSVKNGTSFENKRFASSSSGSPGESEDNGETDRERVMYEYAILGIGVSRDVSEPCDETYSTAKLLKRRDGPEGDAVLAARRTASGISSICGRCP